MAPYLSTNPITMLINGNGMKDAQSKHSRKVTGPQTPLRKSLISAILYIRTVAAIMIIHPKILFYSVISFYRMSRIRRGYLPSPPGCYILFPFYRRLQRQQRGQGKAQSFSFFVFFAPEFSAGLCVFPCH